jgi:ChaC-like protein
MTVKPPNTPPRWVTVKAGQEAVSAIAFVANRHGPNFVGGLTPEQIANVLCRAVGHWDSGVEYLMQTVDHLERLGITDSNLAPTASRGAAIAGHAGRGRELPGSRLSVEPNHEGCRKDFQFLSHPAAQIVYLEPERQHGVDHDL